MTNKGTWKSPETRRRIRGHAFHAPLSVMRKIPALYETEAIEAEDKIVHLHYFTGSMDWYIVEMDSEGLAFGYVKNGQDSEWGYIDMNELEDVCVFGWRVVERDCWWNATRFGDV